MIERIYTLEQQIEQQIYAQTCKIHRDNLRQNLDHRLAKAKAQNNQTLIAQLEDEFRDLHLED